MKKLYTAVVCFFMAVSLAWAAESKEFIFSSDLLESLNYAQKSMDAYVTKVDKVEQRMDFTLKANKELESGKEIIKKYLVDEDDKVKTISEGVLVGIELLIENNQKLIELIKKLQESDISAVKSFDTEFAKIKQNTQSGWEMIALSSSHLFYVIANPEANPVELNNRIEFKISVQEKEKLFSKTNSYFKDKIKKYDRFKALEKKGKKTDSQDQNYLSFTLARIRDMLMVYSYKDAKEKELLKIQ